MEAKVPLESLGYLFRIPIRRHHSPLCNSSPEHLLGPHIRQIRCTASLNTLSDCSQSTDISACRHGQQTLHRPKEIGKYF